MRYYLNIGSNKGNKMLNLSKAISLIEKEFGWFELSAAIESDAWGYESKNRFVNIGMLVISEIEPLEVLHKLQSIELAISPEPHRDAYGNYKDRIIDIDIVAMEDENRQSISYKDGELTIPHPHLEEREFFLKPLNELQVK